MVIRPLDEHVPDAIGRGLRQRGIDVTTTEEASLGGEDVRPRRVLLMFRSAHSRPLVTYLWLGCGRYQAVPWPDRNGVTARTRRDEWATR